MSEGTVLGYELWSTESRNLLDDFDTEAEALETIRQLIELNGPDCTDGLALTRVEVGGRMTTLAMGDALAECVRLAAGTQSKLPT
jgi:hypothetical protein